jgi:putative spermidine/putrescine transport system ATP-binding protein
MTALVYSGVRKTFGPIAALEDFDLTVQPGELIALLGPSGCGKTTALRIAAGFEKPDAGTVSVSGTDVTHRPAHKRNMGMVFQSYSLFPNLTVAANIEYGLRTRKLAAPERRRRVDEMLELVQLGKLAQRYPHQLSGGQQQRVALARALAIQPEVLLLDEPLSALDAKVRLTLRDEIRRVQTALGITTMFVTHDQEEALGISDRVGVMSLGRLEQLAPPAEVYRNPSSAFVARFVGSMNELPAVVQDSAAVEVAGSIIATPSAAGMGRGERVLMLVRPEDVSVGDASAAGLPATVTARTFQGAATIIQVRVDRIDTLAAAHLTSTSATHLAPGDRVTIAIDGARALCEAV